MHLKPFFLINNVNKLEKPYDRFSPDFRYPSELSRFGHASLKSILTLQLAAHES